MITLIAKKKLIIIVSSLLLLSSYIYYSEKDEKNNQYEEAKEKEIVFEKIIAYSQQKVPVLCYHAIRNINKKDSPTQKTYSVTPTTFALQMKALADNGYKTITPDALYNNIKYHKPLPKKPILITFDDGRKEQYSIGAEEMKKHNFKGIFFIMTVAIGKPDYMTKTEIKALSDNGHTIGCHTWDHHKINQYTKQDWQIQLLKPKKLLENITGKPVCYFAYPYGVWNEAAADSLKKDGYKMAFIVYGKNNPVKPLYTIQRMIVPGSYSADALLQSIKNTFGNQ